MKNFFSSIGRGIRSAASSVYNTTNSVGRTIRNAFSGGRGQTASVLQGRLLPNTPYSAPSRQIFSGSSPNMTRPSNQTPTPTGANYQPAPAPVSFFSGFGGGASRGSGGGGSYAPSSNYDSNSYSSLGTSDFSIPSAPSSTTVSAGTIGSGTPTGNLSSTPGTSRYANSYQGVVNGLNTSSGLNVNAGINPQTGEPALDKTTDNKKPTKTPEQTYQENIQDQLEQLRNPDIAGANRRAENESQILQAQQNMNNSQAQINGVTSKMNTDLLNYRAAVSREGGTLGGFGGIEAEITREATIKLLPLQAQLSADQGNYQAAREHMNTLFSIYSKEAQNSADTFNKGVEARVSILSTNEKQRLVEISDQKQYEVDTWKTMGKRQSDYVMKLYESGNRVGATLLANVRPPSNTNASPNEKALATANYERDMNNILAEHGSSIGLADRQEQQARINKANAEQEERKGQYSPKQLTAISKLNQDVSKNSTYSKTTSMRSFGDNVIGALSLATGVGDIAAINQFQKVVDEGAVTRDQDVKLIQASQSLLNTLKTKIKKLEKGDQLSPQLRDQMRELVELVYDKQVEALLKDPFISAKKKEAELNGFDIQDTILGELNTFSNQASAPTPEVEALRNKYSY